MKIESLNCPNCGAAVFSDAASCQFCRSRLKTMACPSCLGVMFSGSKHCPRCGAKAVLPKIASEEKLGKCPRCQIGLESLKIEEVNLRLQHRRERFHRTFEKCLRRIKRCESRNLRRGRRSAGLYFRADAGKCGSYNFCA